jgi:hypothetical protein
MNAFKIAAERNISTETMSVTRDSKRDQLIVVEKVSQPTGPETHRSGVFYFIYDDVPTSDVNELLALSKSGAILAFTGQIGNTKVEEDAAPSTPAAEPEAVKEVESVESEEPKPSKKKTAKKAVKKSLKKKAELKVAKAPEPEPEQEPEVDTDFDGLDDLPEDDVPENSIMYSRTDKSHATTHLRPILIKKLGSEWKKDAAKASKVRELISELSGNVPVTDLEGNVLPSFSAKVEEILDAKLRA